MAQDGTGVLHQTFPDGQLEAADARLPAMRPIVGPWLLLDEAYGAQMGVRRDLLATREADVYAQLPQNLSAARAFLGLALDALPDGFDLNGGRVVCPDGIAVTLDWDAPLWTAGNLFQQDVCILEKQGDEHVLTGAVLCFPASWTLAEKIGKPLVRIHKPVPEYDTSIATRVQRMFDGVQAGRPMWRANALRYDESKLFHPKLEDDSRPISHKGARFIRSERQTVLRLPQDGAVAFTIHTMVVEVGSENGDQHENDHDNG